ncbi:asparagine synthase (glutamine-hydrolysing) [Azospirillaceae bacterium]
MCGIIGIVHRVPGSYKPLGVADMARLAHRGPDGNGCYADDQACLGHTRLAIIDLSNAGRQPMASSDGRYVVTFNGEIYNHIELRAELEAHGETFRSHSDTEVLIAAYRVWGQACVHRFRGMFAFALWDTVEQSLFLARDRCGEKPLFYWRDSKKIIFASEIKALAPLLESRPALDVSVVDMYLHYQYVPEPYTLLQNVHKLPAAHTLYLTSADWLASPRRYWNVETIADIGSIPNHQTGILASIRDGIEEAVCMTLRADVPVGVALSGGIDSGAIAVLAQKHYPEPMHAFCVGYPGRPHYDERAQARTLAESLGMIVHEVELPISSFVSFFPELVRIMDEPIADPAAFGHYSVPKAASDLGIKVLLTGIGGDEVFWGYPWVTQTASTNQWLKAYPSLRTLATWTQTLGAETFFGKLSQHPRLPSAIRRWAALLFELITTQGPEGVMVFYNAAPDFRDAFRLKPALYGPAMHALDPDNPFRPTAIGLRNHEEIPAAIIRLLFETWLASNCLSLGDRVSMSVGVESRLPFLDAKLIELVMALRAQHPDHKLGQKAWLRAALKGVLPDEVLTRPKAGFQPPVHAWLSGVIAEYGNILRDGRLVHAGILDANHIDDILVTLPTQGWPGLFFAYKIILLESWVRQVVEI